MTGQMANQMFWVGENSAALEGDRPGLKLATVALAPVDAALARSVCPLTQELRECSSAA